MASSTAAVKAAARELRLAASAGDTEAIRKLLDQHAALIDKGDSVRARASFLFWFLFVTDSTIAHRLGARRHSSARVVRGTRVW